MRNKDNNWNGLRYIEIAPPLVLLLLVYSVCTTVPQLSTGDLCIAFFLNASHIRDEPLIIVGVGQNREKKGREAHQKKKSKCLIAEEKKVTSGTTLSA